MSFGGRSYAGGAFAGSNVEDIPTNQPEPIPAIEVAFTTGALETPVWESVSGDVRSWSVVRGRRRELERFQPGQATIVLDNRSRQYDSQYASGPHFGNLKPSRRIRIRETINGVTYPTFDGYVDKWQLDYPATGKDATATIMATDATKFFGRTDLPRSVYESVVSDDNPTIWWKLNEPQTRADETLTALNSGSLGSDGDGTFVGSPKLGVQGLIDRDPGTAMGVTDSDANPGTPDQGIALDTTDFNLLQDHDSWAIECWVRPEEIGSTTGDIAVGGRVNAGGGMNMVLGYKDTSGGFFQGRVVNSATTEFTVSSATGQTPWERYHLVLKHGPSRVLSLYVNGTKTTGDTTTGSFLVMDLIVGFLDDSDGAFNWRGTIDQVAVYVGETADDPLTDAQVAAHYAAGTAPWQDDQPDDRIDRVLDIVEWPDDLREVDAGNVALQSAELGTTALEHLQKVGETEFGLLFIARDGKVRLVDRAAQFARQPGPAVIGDGSGEVGYRDIKFDDGDSVIRNRATISRLNGVAQVDESTASVTEFGRFDYSQEGLLHRLDSFSDDYAEFVVAEYKDPRRRVVSLDLGPAKADAGAYEQMLGRELGDAITVKNRPPGGGDAFEQVCVIEGVEHAWSPKVRTTRWILSPEFSTSF